MSAPAAYRMAVVAGRRVVMVRVAIVAKVFALLLRMVECPLRTDCMADIARAEVPAWRMAGGALGSMAAQA